MKFYRTDSSDKMWRYSDLSGTDSIPTFRGDKKETDPEMSGKPYILTRVSAREHFIVFAIILKNSYVSFKTLFFMAQQVLVGQGLLIFEALWSHSDTPHSVGLLWTRNESYTETYTWQQATLTRDSHLFPGWNLNPQFQQASRRRPTP